MHCELHIVNLPQHLFYYTLGNLSPKYRSSYSVLIAVKSKVLVRYGGRADKILKPVLDEIKQQECVRLWCMYFSLCASYRFL